MKKMFFLIIMLIFCLISISASEKEALLNNDTVKSTENIKFNFNIAAKNSTLTDGAVNFAAKTTGAGADFYTFLKKNQQLFFWLAIGLSIGAVVFLSMAIAGTAMLGWYWNRWTNPATRLDPHDLDPVADLNIYYAGIALAAVGWTLFTLTLIGAGTCWAFYIVSVTHEKGGSGSGSSKQPAKKRRMLFEISPTRIGLGMQFN